MNKDEALMMAVEALEDNQHYIAENERHKYVMLYNEIINKCKEALEQPAQEPVAYILRNEYNEYRLEPMDNLKITDFPVEVEVKLYTHPHQWQGLTDEHLLGQLFGIRFQRHTENLMSNPPQIKYSYTIQESDLIKFARAIEQAHGIGIKDE